MRLQKILVFILACAVMVLIPLCAQALPETDATPMLVSSVAELADLCAQADSADPVAVETIQPLLLEQRLTIPQNVTLYVRADAPMQIDGASGKLTVKGSLVLEAGTSLWIGEKGRLLVYGNVTVLSDATLECAGRMWLYPEATARADGAIRISGRLKNRADAQAVSGSAGIVLSEGAGYDGDPVEGVSGEIAVEDKTGLLAWLNIAATQPEKAYTFRVTHRLYGVESFTLPQNATLCLEKKVSVAKDATVAAEGKIRIAEDAVLRLREGSMLVTLPDALDPQACARVECLEQAVFKTLRLDAMPATVPLGEPLQLENAAILAEDVPTGQVQREEIDPSTVLGYDPAVMDETALGEKTYAVQTAYGLALPFTLTVEDVLDGYALTPPEKLTCIYSTQEEPQLIPQGGALTELWRSGAAGEELPLTAEMLALPEELTQPRLGDFTVQVFVEGAEQESIDIPTEGLFRYALDELPSLGENGCIRKQVPQALADALVNALHDDHALLALFEGEPNTQAYTLAPLDAQGQPIELAETELRLPMDTERPQTDLAHILYLDQDGEVQISEARSIDGAWVATCAHAPDDTYLLVYGAPKPEPSSSAEPTAAPASLVAPTQTSAPIATAEPQESIKPTVTPSTPSEPAFSLTGHTPAPDFSGFEPLLKVLAVAVFLALVLAAILTIRSAKHK